MGRVSNYRSKLVDIIENANDRYNSLCDNEEPYDFIGNPEDDFEIKMEISSAEKVLRLLDALKEVGVVEGKGFCDEIANATGYSKTRISNMLSNDTSLHTRFIKAVCSGFGLNEEFIIDGKGSMTVDSKPDKETHHEDIAIKEAISVMHQMSEPLRWRAVAVLKEMFAGGGK